jgi:hypothetical protein
MKIHINSNTKTLTTNGITEEKQKYMQTGATDWANSRASFALRVCRLCDNTAPLYNLKNDKINEA